MAANDISISDILANGTYGFFIFAFFVIMFILSILWLVLPFFIFKIKSILIENNIQLMRMNRYLMSVESLLKKQIEGADIRHTEYINKESVPTEEQVIEEESEIKEEEIIA